jgi:hypothetical protein
MMNERQRLSAFHSAFRIPYSAFAFMIGGAIDA